MHITAVRRWKRKERKFNQRYKLNKVKKTKQPRDLKGKFVFLLTKTNLCAVLKFLSKNICVTQALLTIDNSFINWISSKYLIPHRRHRKLLAQSEVRVTKSFQVSCEKYHKKSKWITKKVDKAPVDKVNGLKNEQITLKKPDPVVEEEQPKISPIKILSCKICNEKFLRKDLLEKHIIKAHYSDEDSTGSEGELTIDDDIELVLDINNLSGPNSNNDKVEAKPSVSSNLKYNCLQCTVVCATQDSLLAHIERTHPCSSSASATQHLDYEFIENSVKEEELNESTNLRRSVSSNSSRTTTSKRSSVESPEKEKASKIQKFVTKENREFICKICSVSFKQRPWLNRHVLTTHLSIVYKCFKCNVPFNKKLHLVRHIKTAHLKYSDEKGFIGTLENPESVGYFQCCFCKYSSKFSFKVEDHLTNEHYEDFEKNEAHEDSVSSSPDSLEELLLPETRALKNGSEVNEEDLLMEIVHKDDDSNQNKRRKGPNDPSFRYRCARCHRRFSRSSWLKKHPCITPRNITIKSEPEDSLKKAKVSYEVNGFLRCRNNSCSQVFTDRKLYENHIKTAH